ncbi:MAG: UvrD-helicase domain-containing protein [Clostridiales bacterium]|nr:UvrD-helicase domain-containing protein [Clostridiales bacterium]
MLNLDHLNEQQREAALHGEGPLLILAGAGSGKTSVMTHRIARLILDEGINPRNMLAVTFTNKAAGEMRERVAKLIYGAEEMEREGESLLKRMSGYGGLWILTFHSACLRILHSYADRLGYTNNFAVYDPTDQKAAIKRCVKELDLDPKQFSPQYVLAAIGGFKEDGKTPEALLAETEAAGTYVGPRRRHLAELYRSYAETLKRNNAMDFDDLLTNAVRLFKEHPDVLEYYQNKFHYIMVDEYQDTNHTQYMFVKMLAERSGNLCVVGDDDQSIYGWRGADIRNILDFEKDFKGACVIKLEQNYRSHANILDCANSVIRGNKGRKDKALWTSKGAGDKVIYRQVYDEREEARFVAGEVTRLAAAGRPLRDMAVLTRTNAQSRTFEEAFISHGLKYRVLGQVRYYDRKEVKDMLSYMALAANPKDDVAFMRIINEPRRGIGEKSVAAIAAAAGRAGVSMLEFLAAEGGGTRDGGAGDGARDDLSLIGDRAAPLTGKTADAAYGFAAIMTSYADIIDQMSVSDFYDELLLKTGYMKALEEKGAIEDMARVENLLEFRSAIVASEAEDENLTLASFLEKTALMSDVDNLDRDADAVVVMTMHSAKGLEFPVVFLPGMEEGLFPSLRGPASDDEIEEERRLCYVGMTRAMERLYLLRAKSRMIYGHRDYTMESRFLNELDQGVLDPDADMPGGELSGYLHGNPAEDWGGARPAGGSPWGGRSGGGSPRGASPAAGTPRGGNKGVGSAAGTPRGGNRGVGSAVGTPRGAFETAKAEVKQRGGAVLDLNVGDRVAHRKFGAGLVIESEGGFATVMFDTEGRKKLALDIAPLERL